MEKPEIERRVAAIIEKANEIPAAYWPELVGNEYRKLVLAHVVEADEIRELVLQGLNLSHIYFYCPKPHSGA